MMTEQRGLIRRAVDRAESVADSALFEIRVGRQRLRRHIQVAFPACH